MANFLVTGTSSGIGEDAALRLDRLGHRVFAGVRNERDGAALTERASDRLTPILCDVADESSVADALTAVDDAVGDTGLQGLVNNAGVARAGPLEHLPLDEWRDQFDVNVFGQIAVTRAALPLIRRGGGRICFVGSIGGRVGTALMGPYNGSKFAIEGIAMALRQELHPWGVPVSVIEPGPIKTEIWRKGREYATEFEERLGTAAADQYRAQIDAAVAGVDRSERVGDEPSKTSDAIEHALLARRPRQRYLVGTPAKAVGTLARVLPDGVLSAAVRRFG